MTRRERWSGLTVAMTASLVVMSTAALAGPARAADGAEPVVVPDPSALPQGCVSLGDVSGRHGDEPPRPERAQADALQEARQKGATHVVTGSAYRCGGNSFCFEGVAYRCPASGGNPAAK